MAVRRYVYVTSDSYPELRDVASVWARGGIWWRAIARGLRHADFVWFVIAQVALLACAVGIGGLGTPVAGIGILLFVAYLQVSWGGDIMRQYLRGVSEVARYACPSCGHSLVGHVQGAVAAVRCPECATEVARATFNPPFPIDREHKAFPPW